MAAREVFARTGFRGSSLSDVAKRAGITAAGILHHFATKEALLLAVVDDLLDRQRDLQDAISDLGGLDGLRRMPDMAERLAADTELIPLIAVLAAENIEPDAIAHGYFVRHYARVRRWLADVIRVGQERGEIRRDIDPVSKASEIIAFQDGTFSQWLFDPKAISLTEQYRRYIDAVIRDIGTQSHGQGAPRGSKAS